MIQYEAEPMGKHMDPPNIRNNILPLLLVSVIILGILYLYWTYVSTIVMAGTLAIVLYTPYRWCCRYLSERQAACIVIIMAVIILMIISLFVVSVLFNSSGYLIQMSDTITFWLEQSHGLGFIRGNVFSSMTTITSTFIKNAMITIATSVPYILLNTLFFMLSLFLFLMYGKDLAEEFLSAIPDHLQGVTSELRKDVVSTLYATYVVNLQICLITFIIAIPFYALLGIKDGVIENATLTAVSQLIPTIAPLFVLVFIGLYAMALGDITLAILVLIIGYILFMFIPGTLLKPKMMGKRVSLPAPMMMIAIIGAIATVGLPGIILGPLFAALWYLGIGF